MRKPDNLAALERLQVASFYAGRALTQVYIGYVHAFSHAIGGKFGVSHGLGNAVLLPHVMRFYQTCSQDRFARLARIVGLGEETDSPAALAQRFVDALFRMNQESGIPERLEAFPPAAIEEIIGLAFREAHGTYPVPWYYSREGARALLRQICAE